MFNLLLVLFLLHSLFLLSSVDPLVLLPLSLIICPLSSICSPFVALSLQWELRSDVKITAKDIEAELTPEDMCVYELLIATVQRLKDMG